MATPKKSSSAKNSKGAPPGKARSTLDGVAVFKSLLALSAPPLCITALSPDQIRRHRIREKLLEHFAPSIKSAGGCERYSCDEITVQKVPAILDALASRSLFSAQTVVILDRVEFMSAPVTALLIEGISKISGDGESVLLCLGTELPAAHPIRKWCIAHHSLIELPLPPPDEFRRWIAKEFHSLGITKLDPQVVELMLSAADGSPDTAYELITRCALYSDGVSVGVHDAHEIFAARANLNDFALLDALTSRKQIRAQALIQELLRDGRNPFLMVNMLFRSVMNLLKVKTLEGRGLTGSGLAQEMGGSPWLLQKQSAQARSLSLARLMAAPRAFLRADRSLKNRSVGADGICDGVVYSIMGE